MPPALLRRSSGQVRGRTHAANGQVRTNGCVVASMRPTLHTRALRQPSQVDDPLVSKNQLWIDLERDDANPWYDPLYGG